MHDPYFFGYGSLVNRATHAYPGVTRATLSGWRRAWRHTRLRELAYLTVIKAPGAQIDGLIAAVPGRDWAALDAREHAYDRHAVTCAPERHAPGNSEVHIYAVDHRHSEHPGVRHPILLSYIDVVVQGYLREYGEAGALRFFDSTDGWDIAIVDDRGAPAYPRHQRLSTGERGFVDAQLARLPAKVEKRV